MNEFAIVDYDPAWPQKFAGEVAGLRQALGERLIALEHIGSTSVVGLAAKPIVDIQAVVISVAEMDNAISALAAHGYQQGVFAPDPVRHLYFKKHDSDGRRTHQLHMYEAEHPAADAHLLFRDYLRAHPEEAAAYQALKRVLCQQYAQDRLAYSDAKTDYIQSVLAKAIEIK